MTWFKKYGPILLILAFSLSAWLLGISKYFTFDALKQHHDFIESYVQAHQILAVVIYGALYVVLVGLSIPGAAFMTILAGVLFGQILGTLYAVLAATLGAMVLFMSAKKASQTLLAEKAGPWVQKMQQGFQDNAFAYLMTLRLIPLFPFVAVNLVCAVLQIPLLTFFMGTLLGIIPGSFVYVSIGVALQNVINKPDFSPQFILEPKILIALTGLGVLSLVPVIYKWIQGKHKA